MVDSCRAIAWYTNFHLLSSLLMEFHWLHDIDPENEDCNKLLRWHVTLHVTTVYMHIRAIID